jgi:hypothetical protein
MGLTIATIVCAYNESRLLAGCLYSLRAQTRPPDDIVVINNASTDETSAVARAVPGAPPARGRRDLDRRPGFGEKGTGPCGMMPHTSGQRAFRRTLGADRPLRRRAELLPRVRPYFGRTTDEQFLHRTDFNAVPLPKVYRRVGRVDQ